MSVPDHPDITKALVTGYPTFSQPEDISCDFCGADLNEETVYEGRGYRYLCRECLLMLHEKWR